MPVLDIAPSSSGGRPDVVAAARRLDRTASIATIAARDRDTVFLNVPYDQRYEPLYVALIAGLCGLGLNPRTTLEIPGSRRRLERIVELIRSCEYSIHDLSRIQASGPPPRVPRFNMAFELGLAVCWSLVGSRSHEWFLFEEMPHRLQRSLSDLNGTDPYIHNGAVDRVLVELTNAFVRVRPQPPLEKLQRIHRLVHASARRLRRTHGTLFSAVSFRQLVLTAAAATRDLS